MGKRINQATLRSLKEALSAIYWYKGDLESFVKSCVSHPEVISRLNFSDNKRVVASQVVDLLASDQDVYLPTLLGLMEEIASFSDFSHLARLDDGASKVERARRAVASLREQYEGHANLVAEREAVAKRRGEAQVAAAKRQAMQESLDELRRTYVELLSLEPQT